MSPNPNITIAVHHISRGAQPGPYAPHVYESFLVVSGENVWDRLNGQQVRKLVKAVVCDFPEDDDGPDDIDHHFQPHLKKLTLVEEVPRSEGPLAGVVAKWHVRIEIPYTD
jgi:hypothetical protein